ncbi:MAG: hypothetical protein KDB07_04975, partial [Planctomycetes bacterium]|nr:hypothetical protein [Planctomycetota bacterium]
DEARSIWGHSIAPKTVPELWAVFEGLGLSGISLDLGAFAWFRPKQFARDEGKYAADILFNALGHKAARARYLDALDHFHEHERFYGYVVISGVKGVH